MNRKESKLTDIIATKDTAKNTHMIEEWTDFIIDSSGDEIEGLKSYKVHSSPVFEKGAVLNRIADNKFQTIGMNFILTEESKP